MSADESALLAAVAADPGNDLPRLVYADFLDDHGQAIRAEFIRLQCQIAKLEVGPRAVVDRNWRLWKRQQDLLDDYLPELLGSAAFLADCQPEFERGFVSQVRATDAQLLSFDAVLTALRPLPQVSVAHEHSLTPAAFLGSPALGCVTDLYWTELGDQPDDDPNPLDPIRRLAAASGRLSRLHTLDLTGWMLHDGHAELLATADFPALRSLILADNGLSDAGVITLLAAPYVRRLSHWSLDTSRFVGDQAAFELADRLAPVKTFRTLDFRRTNVTSAGQLALTTAFGSRCNLF